MGRFIIPADAEAFGYQRQHADRQATDGMHNYTPENIGQALGLAEHVLDRYGLPVARSAYMKVAREKAGMMPGLELPGLELPAQESDHGYSQLLNHGIPTGQRDGPDITSFDATRLPDAGGDQNKPVDAGPMPIPLRRRPIIAGTPGLDPPIAPVDQNIAPPAKAQKPDTAPDNTPEIAKLKAVQQRTIDAVNGGAQLSPRAQAQFKEVQARIAQLENQQATAPAPVPEQGQQTKTVADADKMAAGIERGQATAQMPVQPQGLPAQAGAQRQPPAQFGVDIQPGRMHSINELHALIGAAHQTGAPEDYAKVQQAIMQAPMDDAEPQSWEDVIRAATGMGTPHRDRQRADLLKQLDAGKALSELDKMRMENMHSQIGARDERNLLLEQQTRAATQKADVAYQYYMLQTQQQLENVRNTELRNAAAQWGVASAKYKAVKASTDAAYQQKMDDAKIEFERKLGGAAVTSAEARRAHELPGDVHRYQPSDGEGAAKRRDLESLRNRLRDIDANLAQSSEGQKRAVGTLLEHMRKTGDFDAAVKMVAGNDKVQRDSLEKLRGWAVQRHRITGEMEIAGEDPARLGFYNANATPVPALNPADDVFAPKPK